MMTTEFLISCYFLEKISALKMNKMNIFSLLVVFGVLATLAFSQPQQRVERSPDDDWEDNFEKYSDAGKLKVFKNSVRRANWRTSCISECHFTFSLKKIFKKSRKFSVNFFWAIMVPRPIWSMLANIFGV
jgi:hypothetical protein